jgi:hypothetical protein
MVIEMMEFSSPKNAKEQVWIVAPDSVLIVGRGKTLIGDVMLVSENAVIQIIQNILGFLMVRILINS